MYLDETQRFQMALNTDFVLLLTNTRHAIKRKMQEQRNFCTVDGSLREIVFTPRTDRSIRRHSIRTTLFFFSLSSPIFFFFLFSRYILILFQTISQSRGISARIAKSSSIQRLCSDEGRLVNFRGYALYLLTLSNRLLLY